VGGVVEMASWRDGADAILLAWQPGQEAGNAIADVLTGKTNPSGKLATTFPLSYNDVPSAKNFPGRVTEEGDPANRSPLRGAKAAEVVYEEGINTGYRYYATLYQTERAPAYEFGYGLSYTSFSYGKPRPGAKNSNGNVSVSVDILNNGKRAGKEVVELYVTAPGKDMPKPPIELKGFAKTNLLQPGQKQTISFTLDPRSLASFDIKRKSWVVEPGSYTIHIGSSSKNINGSLSFSVPKEIIVEKDE
jgi:beta-glucosidase